MPLPMFSSNAANVKIDPRIGPMQGVQPKPKAAPTSNGNVMLLLYWSVKILMSLFIKLKLRMPIKWSEKNIIITPAMILKIFELTKKNCPINVAVDPNAMKTKENPKTCSCPVKIAIPVNNKIAPPTFVMVDMYFLKPFENNKNLSIKIPEIIKGMAKPKE